jgi:group I intron endonuclease
MFGCLFFMFYKPKIGIYKITNPAGKIYIGQSTNIENRFNYYKRQKIKDQPLLFNSFTKYSIEKHIFEIITFCSLEDLNNLERFYIEMFQSNNRKYGLNLTNGGQDYFKHNPETLLKMSKAQMGNKKTLGRKATKEEIEKRVAKLKGKKRTIEQRLTLSKAFTGRKYSEERNEKMRQKLKHHCIKRIIDINTKVIYLGTREAALALGMNRSTLIAQLNGQNSNKTNLRYE